MSVCIYVSTTRLNHLLISAWNFKCLLQTRRLKIWEFWPIASSIDVLYTYTCTYIHYACMYVYNMHIV